METWDAWSLCRDLCPSYSEVELFTRPAAVNKQDLHSERTSITAAAAETRYKSAPLRGKNYLWACRIFIPDMSIFPAWGTSSQDEPVFSK